MEQISNKNEPSTAFNKIILESISKICANDKDFRNKIIKNCNFPNRMNEEIKEKFLKVLGVQKSQFFRLKKNTIKLEKSSTTNPKKNHVEQYLENEVFSHSEYFRKSFFPRTILYKKYKKKYDGQDLCAGEHIFNEVWNEMHITLAKKKRFDLYGCLMCKRSEDHSTILDSLQQFLNTKNDFKCCCEDPNVINAFKLKKLDVNFTNDENEFWRKLEEIYNEIKLHNELRNHQREQFELSITKSMENSNFNTIVMDFCKFHTNFKENCAVHVLVMAFYSTNYLQYKCFVMPKQKKKINLNTIKLILLLNVSKH